ncbi:hypothetical protein PENDEC_c085G06175 [Penicillium decumbens]|uniref:Uncharacterized protein n=2 Tax=Penicillium TaxID=5073 RepID=A0A1V6NM17_PENDC|nr:hypothetical protein PENDEC_c085G06175 [Penicillium decumbens]
MAANGARARPHASARREHRTNWAVSLCRIDAARAPQEAVGRRAPAPKPPTRSPPHATAPGTTPDPSLQTAGGSADMSPWRDRLPKTIHADWQASTKGKNGPDGPVLDTPPSKHPALPDPLMGRGSIPARGDITIRQPAPEGFSAGAVASLLRSMARRPIRIQLRRAGRNRRVPARILT